MGTQERPEDSPPAVGGPLAEERAPKRARVEGETTPLPPTAVPNHETAAALRVMLSCESLCKDTTSSRTEG